MKQGAQVTKCVHPAAKVCTPGAGCTLNFTGGRPCSKTIFCIPLWWLICVCGGGGGGGGLHWEDVVTSLGWSYHNRAYNKSENTMRVIIVPSFYRRGHNQDWLTMSYDVKHMH